MYFVSAGLLVKQFAIPEFWSLSSASAGHFVDLSWSNFFLRNLLPVTLGNIIGGVSW